MRVKRTEEVTEVEIMLVPLIDCVFLLMIFFMYCGSMSKMDSYVSINLPVASNAAEQKDPGRRGTVNILTAGSRTPEGEIVRDDKPFMVFGKLVDEEGLEKAIAEHLKTEPTMRLYLRAERDVKFAMIRRAMGACAAGGVADVIFATRQQDLQVKENK